MEDAFTYTVYTDAKARHIDGGSYTVETNGALIIRKADGDVVSHFAPGHWTSIDVEKNDPAKPKGASKKAEKDAAGLTDDQRDVQDMQTLAQTGNPYAGKPDVAAVTGEKAEGSELQSPAKTKIGEGKRA